MDGGLSVQIFLNKTMTKSPFPIHPVNLSTAQLAEHGEEIHRIGEQIRVLAEEMKAEFIKKHPRGPRIVRNFNDVIMGAFEEHGYMWYMPTFTLIFQASRPFVFVIPGDLAAWSKIIRIVIDEMQPMIVVAAIPDGDRHCAYAQDGISLRTASRSFDASFESGRVSQDLHKLFMRPYELPLPKPEEMEEAKKFANLLKSERRVMKNGEFKFVNKVKKEGE